MTLTVVKTTALTGTITNAQLAGGIDLTSKVTGTLPIANGGTNSTATTFVNATTNVTGALPVANGGTGATSFSPGKIGQVLNTINSSEAASSSSTFATTGLNLSITPTATSSKVLVVVTQAGVGKNSSNTKCQLKLQRGTTDIHQFDSDAGYNAGTASNYVGSSSVCYLDSPNTTSATNYRTVFASSANSSNVSVNTNSSDSTITLMEILA